MCLADRIEGFFYDKLDKKKREHPTNTEFLGEYMIDGGNDFGPGTSYGKWYILKLVNFVLRFYNQVWIVEK